MSLKVVGIRGSYLTGPRVMRGFFDFLNPQNWNLDPTLSPTFTSLVQPALNVGGTLLGVPNAGNLLAQVGGTLQTTLSGGTAAPALPSLAPSTMQAPAPGTYTPSTPPASSVTATMQAPAPAMSTGTKIALIGGGVALVGLITWLALRSPKRKD